MPEDEERVVSEDERIARLTELARRVWTQRRNVRVTASEDAAFVMADVGSQSYPVISIPHPRALDALEVALLVLADEVEFRRKMPPREITAFGPTAIEYADGGTLHIVADDTPAWVEKLAKEWDKTADDLHVMADKDLRHEPEHRARAESYAECAAELHERAKGQP